MKAAYQPESIYRHKKYKTSVGNEEENEEENYEGFLLTEFDDTQKR